MFKSSEHPLGAGWVAVQLVLFLFVFIAPLLDVDEPPTLLAVPLGLVVTGAGLIFTLLGVLGLGRSLSIFPRPLPTSELVQTGVYALARHPIYTGIIFAALGWSIVNWSWLAFAGAVALLLFFDRKAAFEETMLLAKYPAYADYRRRVKKLIPGVY